MNKTALKALAIEVRRELDLTPYEKFNPFELASLYGIDVIRLTDSNCSHAALDYFTKDKPHVFSGALVPLSDGSTVIIENDSHTVERRASTGSHEMAHVVLEHPFTATLTDSKGCRVADSKHEKEAAELSGELLLPSVAARQLAFDGVSDEEAARRFGVSIELARWRLNVSGARMIAKRASAKYSSARI